MDALKQELDEQTEKIQKFRKKEVRTISRILYDSSLTSDERFRWRLHRDLRTSRRKRQITRRRFERYRDSHEPAEAGGDRVSYYLLLVKSGDSRQSHLDSDDDEDAEEDQNDQQHLQADAAESAAGSSEEPRVKPEPQDDDEVPPKRREKTPSDELHMYSG